MNRSFAGCVLVLALGLLLGGCGSDNGGGGSGGGGDDNAQTYLTVTARTPAPGSSGLLTNTAVSATFSEALDCATVSAATFTVRSGPTGTGGGVAGALDCALDTVTFSPTGTGFSYSTVYTALITTAVQASGGRALENGVAWSFTVKPPTVSIAMGWSHQIAIAADVNSSFAYSWGDSTYYLGRPQASDYFIPTLVNIAKPYAAGIGEGQSHVVTMDVASNTNQVYGWGDNVFGEVGTGAKNVAVETPTVITFPTLSTGLTPTIIASAGSPVHTLALDSDGRVWAWGNNCVGQLGDGTIIERLAPVLVSFPTPTPVIVAIDASVDSSAPCEYFSMALDDAGTVWVWGSNAHGQLAQLTEGDGGIASSPTPTIVNQLKGTPMKYISAGWRYAVASAESGGQVYAWGDNNTGTLGNGSCAVGSYSADPVPVKGPGGVGALTGIGRLSASKNGAFTLGIAGSGNVWGWGDNSTGQLGDGTYGATEICGGSQTLVGIRLYPVQAAGITGVRQVKAGMYHSMAVKNDGTVWAWGDNTSCLLGKGVTPDCTTTTVLTPTRVPGM